MKLGLIGFAAAGKRTLFTLLTGRAVPEGHAEHDAIEGVAPVRDPRVDRLKEICKPEKATYADNTIVLCPDIVAGDAHRHWLEPARRCDLLCVVIRRFAADDVYHPAGSVDAERDRREIDAELLLTDLDLVEKRLERIGKEKRDGQTPEQALEEKTLLKCKDALDKESKLVDAALDEHEIAAVRSLEFLTLKPVLWAYNVSEEELGASAAGTDGFQVSCRIEQEIMAIDDPGERAEYLKSLGIGSSGLDRLNAAAYDVAGLMSFYTVANNQVRAWTIRKGTAAPVAGGKVHTDIQRGFIRVEVIKFDDLEALGSEKAVKDAGKMQLKGREYVIEDGDVCRFRFNV